MTSTETEQIAEKTPGRAAGRRAFFLRLHFYAGLLIGPFLLIAAVTGGLYAVAPSIEQWVYRDYLSVAPTEASVPLADQVRAAEERRPDLTVTAVRPAPAPGDTTRVMFADPALGPSERHAVFVDPGDARALGELTVYGSSGALPLRTWIDNLHRSLHLGDPGRIYSELAASWLWLIALGGVFLWVSRFRRARSLNARLFTVDRSTKGRRRTLNWHGATGIWMALGLLFLSATGLTWSTYAGANIDEMRSAWAWTTPTVSKTLTVGTDASGPAGHGDHGDHIAGAGAPAPGSPRVDELDRVLQAARASGVDGAVEIGVPADADTAFVVAQTRQPWVMSNNSVAVDGATGRITDASWFPDWPLAAKLAAWGIQLHMGLLFGVLNQLILLAIAIALTSVIVRGYRMWWQRRPTRGGFGRAPRRGALSELPAGAAVGVVVAAAAIGWFVPLLGISLAGFVVVDVGVAWWRRWREAQPPREQSGADARLYERGM